MSSKKEKKRKCDADDNGSDCVSGKEMDNNHPGGNCSILEESNMTSSTFLTSETK